MDWAWIATMVIAGIAALFTAFKTIWLPYRIRATEDEREFRQQEAEKQREFDQRMAELKWESEKATNDTKISQVQLDKNQAIQLCREQLEFTRKSNADWSKAVLDLSKQISQMNKTNESLRNNILQLIGVIADLKDKIK